MIGCLYCKKRRRGGPIGDPAQQCWQFSIRDRNIKGGVHRAGTAVVGGTQFTDPDDAGCVALQSAIVEDGEATFVICCRKDARGKCRNCFVLLQLEVFEPDDRTKLVARKKVTIECAPGP